MALLLTTTVKKINFCSMGPFFSGTHCKNVNVFRSYFMVVIKNLLNQSCFQVKKVWQFWFSLGFLNK